MLRLLVSSALGVCLVVGCRLTPEAAPASGPATPGPEGPPALDPQGVDPYGRPLAAGAFEALAAEVDTATVAGVAVFPGGGVYHDGEAPVGDGETWQALVPVDGGLALRSVPVRVETARDELLDPEAGPFTGRRVTTPFSAVSGEGWVEDSTVALVRRPGAPFPEGPVPTAFVGRWAFEGGALHLALGDTRYELTYVDGPEAAPGRRPGRVVMLAADGGPARPVARLVDRDGGHPAVLWAGDLDRDGRLDLLLDESWHYNVSALALYLSSSASGGAPVRRAAVHETTGC